MGEKITSTSQLITVGQFLWINNISFKTKIISYLNLQELTSNIQAVRTIRKLFAKLQGSQILQK